MKKLWTTSVLPTGKSQFRGHPKSAVNSLLSMKRSNRNLSFNSRKVTLVEMFFLPCYAQSFFSEPVCVQRAGHLLCLGIQCIRLSAREEMQTLSFTELSSRISCVSGASWSQEVKEQLLSVDCSFGLHLSLGIHKTPLFPAHDSFLFKSTHFFKLDILCQSLWESHKHTCAHTHAHTSYHFMCMLYIPLTVVNDLYPLPLSILAPIPAGRSFNFCSAKRTLRLSRVRKHT